MTVLNVADDGVVIGETWYLRLEGIVVYLCDGGGGGGGVD